MGTVVSDTRESLRRFFEIDTANIVVASLSALEQEGSLDAGTTNKAAKNWVSQVRDTIRPSDFHG